MAKVSALPIATDSVVIEQLWVTCARRVTTTARLIGLAFDT